ncbi:MAG: enoyl-CoA hydratase/isomerase family protein [Halioglobus sp.]|nr:enoyl-CoA hydratase/isomerase family protein [Halioglobus sp.]
MYDNLTLDNVTPEITRITLNRPDARNALSWAMMKDIKDALRAIDADNRCRVVVLTGAGKSFCAGLDLTDQANPGSIEAVVGPMRGGPRLGMRSQEYMAEMMLLLRKIQQPVIAAINGHAYGGGLGLALASDIRIAAQSAKFCTQFIRLGISGCDAAVSYTLPRLIGGSRAHDMMMTARVVDAQQAETWGLVTRLAEDDTLQDAAVELAQELCHFSPYGLVSTKQAMWANLDATSMEAATHVENRNQILNGLSGDVEEAAAAFFEKRKPNFD